MRMSLAGILWMCSVACAAQVQTSQQVGTSPRLQDGGTREVLESIVIPPIPNAPFTATLATEATKYTADGASMTFVNERRIARDAQGRVYQERWLLVPKGGSMKSMMNWIQIADPKQRTQYNCSTERRICDLLGFNPAGALSAVISPKGTSGPLPDGTGNVAWEDLGKRNIAGVNTVGIRETTTVNVGVMGNDEPLSGVREYWHSDELGINLLSIRTGPMVGKQNFTKTEITLGDPDVQLFALPGGFKVNDQRKNPPISQ